MSGPAGDRPLQGRSILITRPAERGAGLVERLEALGARVAARPTIALEPPADPGPARAALRGLDAYDWVLFTSASGVEHFLDLARRELGRVPSVRGSVVAIGPATAQALERAGLGPSLTAGDSRAEGLAAELGGRVGAGQRVLLVRPEVAREVLPEALREAGAEVDVVAFYRNVPADGVERTAREVASGAFDLVVFTSPSTARRLLEAAASAGVDVAGALSRTAVVAIGDVTAQALREAGLAVRAVAREPSEQGIVEAVLAAG